MSIQCLDIRSRAYNLCCDYLEGAWRDITENDMIIKPVIGGLSNQLYYCSLPPTHPPKDSEPTCALLRIYGQVHSNEALESLITESVIFTLMSERKMGPRLYGVFPGGRIEEYVEGRPLLTRELQRPDYSTKIAQQMAVYHKIKAPIGKKPKFFWHLVDRYMETIKKDMKIHQVPEERKLLVQKFLSYELEKELEWLKKYLCSVPSPVVFSHNDLQEGNILLRENSGNSEDSFCLIDFEYASYNHRGFDIANHFSQWMYDLTTKEPPYFTVNENDFPNKKQQLTFIQAYLRTSLLQENGYSQLLPSTERLEEALREEIWIFLVGPHFTTGLWGLANALVSNIQFGYWEYADRRFDAYFKHKERIVGKTSLERNVTSHWGKVGTIIIPKDY